MRIEHVGLFTEDLERLRRFYERYFGALSNALYRNPQKGFCSYFLSFADGARLELMQMDSVQSAGRNAAQLYTGLAHFAISLGSESAVDALAERLHTDGFAVLDGPRRTGDGYYECVVLDPDGNRIELCA